MTAEYSVTAAGEGPLENARFFVRSRLPQQCNVTCTRIPPKSPLKSNRKFFCYPDPDPRAPHKPRPDTTWGPGAIPARKLHLLSLLGPGDGYPKVIYHGPVSLSRSHACV